jgi:hypothetical protein
VEFFPEQVETQSLSGALLVDLPVEY